MHRFGYLLVALAACGVDPVEPSAPPGLPDCGSAVELLGAVDRSRLLSDLVMLTSFEERRLHRSQRLAAAAIHDELGRYEDLTLRTVVYRYHERVYHDVEALIPGQHALPPLIAGAHFDSYSGMSFAAPGADDNASGTSAVLEAARVLAHCRFPRPIRLVLFSKEESGLHGAMEYVAQMQKETPRLGVHAYINVDMVGMGNDARSLRIDVQEQHLWLARRIAAIVDSTTSLNSSIRSSQYPPIGDAFAFHRYPTVTLIEDSSVKWNPNYHSDRDTLDSLDLSFHAEVARGLVATLATLAGESSRE